MKKVIILTGMPGSGKSTAALEFLKLKIPVIGMGDAVRKEMRRRGMEINNRSIRLFSKRMTAEHGNKYVIDLVKKELIEVFKTANIAVLDGSRRMSEVDEVSNEGYKPVILCIIADKQVRFKRIVKRKNESDFSSYSEFEWREKQELGYGIAEVIASADYYIDNMRSKGVFLEDIKRFLSKVKALK
ncbi:MAG: AAA family ATPase [Candidatus Parvarchaeota archaeon]|jgi:dephospho-CoA kinase|nr:AAA family ATPase [Candidatus Parvarchaeota archaeon]MCL5106715.1 AAA family ATPase [Candidatus Parvarchaeota archaeon]